jgi:hypothetical protein
MTRNLRVALALAAFLILGTSTAYAETKQTHWQNQSSLTISAGGTLVLQGTLGITAYGQWANGDPVSGSHVAWWSDPEVTTSPGMGTPVSVSDPNANITQAGTGFLGLTGDKQATIVQTWVFHAVQPSNVAGLTLCEGDITLSATMVVSQSGAAWGKREQTIPGGFLGFWKCLGVTGWEINAGHN